MAVVELDAQIPDARLFEAVVGLPDPLAHVAHRVLVAGDEKYRQVCVHLVHVGLSGDVGEPIQHVPEEAQGGVPAAEGVGDVGVHVFLAGGHPVEPGAGGGEGLVVGPEGQIVGPGAEGLFAQAADLPVRDELPSGDEGRGLVAGAAENAAVQSAGVADQVSAGEEGAHGVAEEEIGLSRKDLGHPAAEGLYVVHHVPPAVLLPQVDHGAALDEGLAVAQVVVGHHHKAVIAEKAGKGGVAGPVLRHAVGNLDHAQDLPLRRGPLVDMDQGLPVAGRKEKFRCDGHRNLLQPYHYTQSIPQPPGKA